MSESEVLSFVAKAYERSGSMVLTIPSSVVKYQEIIPGSYIHVAVKLADKQPTRVEKTINPKTGDVTFKTKQFNLFKKNT